MNRKIAKDFSKTYTKPENTVELFYELPSEYWDVEDEPEEYKFVVKRALPYGEVAEQEKAAMRINAETREISLDYETFITEIWPLLVVSTEPSIYVKQLRAADSTVSKDILMLLYKHYKKAKLSVKEKESLKKK